MLLALGCGDGWSDFPVAPPEPPEPPPCEDDGRGGCYGQWLLDGDMWRVYNRDGVVCYAAGAGRYAGRNKPGDRSPLSCVVPP